MGERFRKITATDERGNLKAGYQAEEASATNPSGEMPIEEFIEKEAEEIAGPLAGDSINDTPEGAQYAELTDQNQSNMKNR